MAIVILWFSLVCVILLSIITTHTKRLRSQNAVRRNRILNQLGRGEERNLNLVGFFHPYCNAGGGGERVLWTAIAAMQRTEPNVINVVYSGDLGVSKSDIIARVQSRFAITLDPSSLHFVFLTSRKLVEDSTWPRFTLLGQSLGSMYLAWEAMCQLIPDLFIDTMGYAFTFPVVGLLGGIPVGAYVHYPTISTDMLKRVALRRRGHTNAGLVARSRLLSWGKLVYYRLFIFIYSKTLRTASFLMANSSWTKNHVDGILQHRDSTLDVIWDALNWVVRVLRVKSAVAYYSSPDGANRDATQKQPGRRAWHPMRTVQIVYPPCDTREMASFTLTGRERIVVSVAQFRPEKDHAAQILAFAHLRATHPDVYANSTDRDVRLVLIGGSRNDEDLARVDVLRRLATGLGVDDRVDFLVNASYPDMLSWLSRASVGLNTMVDEHFGINVVEYMAAGVIPLTHASGGPLNDIVVSFHGQPTGYHATTPESFAEALHLALNLSVGEDLAMRKRARQWAVQQFSEEEFDKGWKESEWMNWVATRK